MALQLRDDDESVGMNASKRLSLRENAPIYRGAGRADTTRRESAPAAQTGAPVEEMLYYPFGSRWQNSTGFGWDEKFAQFPQRNDDIQKYQASFREYDPGLGRWMSPDRLAGNVMNPQSLDRYVYVLNNPVANIDPLGLQTQTCTTEMKTTDKPCFSFQATSWAPAYDYASLNHLAVSGELNAFVGAVSGSTAAGGGGGFLAKLGKTAECASQFADKVSIAGGLHALGIGKSGVSGFITNALGGNVFSGATDLAMSFGSGEAGGHSVFYHMAQGVAAGPSQGFAAAFGKSLEGTPWAAGPADVATKTIVSGAQRLVTGAGQTIQTLNGTAEMGAVLETASWASGFAELKFGYDAATYIAGIAGCTAGIIP